MLSQAAAWLLRKDFPALATNLVMRLLREASELVAGGAQPGELRVTRIETSAGPKGRAEVAWQAERERLGK